MRSNIEDILARFLEEIEHGKSVQDCLAEYPDLAEELAPLLHLAGAIKQVPTPVPRPEVVQQAVMNARQTLRRTESPPRRLSVRSLWVHPAFVRTALAMCLIIVLGWTTVRLSAASLPGELLYPVKRLSEQVRYFFATNPEGKAELHILFADRRTEEFVLTLEPGERINQALLETMLREAASAQHFINALTGEHGEALQQKIEACNQHQLVVLEQARVHACDCDRDLIDAAIQACRQRPGCMPGTGDADDPCCE